MIMSLSKTQTCRSDSVYGVYGLIFAPYTGLSLMAQWLKGLCTVCTVKKHTLIYIRKKYKKYAFTRYARIGEKPPYTPYTPYTKALKAL